MLFGSPDEIDVFAANFKQDRLERLARERKREEDYLVDLKENSDKQWEEFRSSKNRRTAENQTASTNTPSSIPFPRPSMPKLKIGEDGHPDTSDIDRAFSRAAEELARVIQQERDDSDTYDGAWARFKAGDVDATVGAAYSTFTFAAPSEVIGERVFALGSGSATILNVYNCEYELRWDTLKLGLRWVRSYDARGDGKSAPVFVRVMKPSFEGFRFGSLHFSDDLSFPTLFMGLDSVFEIEPAPPVKRMSTGRFGPPREFEEIPYGKIAANVWLCEKFFDDEETMRADMDEVLAQHFGDVEFDLQNFCFHIIGDG
ncbi:MAG: hypothetical protein BZ138_06675 [Methanosphaera sp. rholeuAM270]|nr:MAG: hypothetical protein BZ138_06675 [Methanosphaera sp. rholeuAM270]